MSTSTTFKPTTFTPYEKFSYPTGFPTECPTGYPFSAPCPTTPFTGYPTTNWTGYPTTTGFGGYPCPTEWTRTWPATYPTEWSTRFGGNWPVEWSRFGGMIPTEWNRFGTYPTESFSRFGANWPVDWTRSPRWETSSWEPSTFDMANWERTFCNDFERSMRTVEREMDAMRRIFDFSTRSGKETTGKRFSTSMVNLPSRPTSSMEYYTFQNPVRYDFEGNRWLSLCFDLPSFKPEEIKVTLYSKANPAYIEVIATHDVKDTKEHTVKRTYERKYFFPTDLCLKPEDIAKLEIKSHFTNEGCLYVECLLPKLTPELAAKERGSRFSLFDYPMFSCPVKCEKKDI